MTTNFQLNAPSTGSQQGGGGSHQPGLLKTPGWYDSIIGHWTAFSWGKKIHFQPEIFGAIGPGKRTERWQLLKGAIQLA